MIPNCIHPYESKTAISNLFMDIYDRNGYKTLFIYFFYISSIKPSLQYNNYKTKVTIW